MYESPIQLLVTDIQQQIRAQMDDEIYKAVVHFIPNIDRAELLRALQYDRDQYDKGYADGKAAAEAATIKAEPVRHGRWVDKFHGEYANAVYHCSACGGSALSDEREWFLTNYCPRCGARMDGDTK